MAISGSHPRIWRAGNRAQWLIDQKAGTTALWTRFQSIKANWQPYCYVLDWTADPTTPKRDAMLAALDTMVAESLGSILVDEGLQAGDQIRDAAFFYDWAWTELDAERKQKLEDYMMTQLFCIWNWYDPWVINQHVEPKGWGVDSPSNNYFPAMFKGAVYAWLATYGAAPTDFDYPFGDDTDREPFWLPGPNGEHYTLEQFVIDRITRRAIPIADPFLSGGGWHEGVWYGGSPFRNYFDLYSVIRDCGGDDYLADFTYYQDRIKYVIANTLEGSATAYRGEKGPQNFGSSERISVLLAVDALRGKGSPEAEMGRYWLTNGPIPYAEDGNPAWSYGADFLFDRNTDPAVDYRGKWIAHHYARGCGQVVMRQYFGANDVTVQIASTRTRQEHACHDNGDWQMHRAGDGISNIYDAFVVCSADTGGASKEWETYHHNAMQFGGGAKPLPGHAAPPALGYPQRFAGYGINPTGEILRENGTQTYSYVQSSQWDAYRPLDGQSNTDTGYDYPNPPKYPENKPNDIWTRELLYLRALGEGWVVVVIYDRAELANNWADPTQVGKIYDFWHVPRNSPLDDGNGVRKNTNGENRLFFSVVLPTSIALNPPYTFTQDPSISPQANHVDPWRTMLDVPTAPSGNNPFRAYGEVLKVYETGDKDVLTSHVAREAISPNGEMRGVTLKFTAGWYHCVFSGRKDGSTPDNVFYDVTKNANSDRHIVANLVPNTLYGMREALVGGSVYRYTLTPNGSGSPVIADKAGVVEFLAGRIGKPPVGGGGGGGPIPIEE